MAEEGAETINIMSEINFNKKFVIITCTIWSQCYLGL